ncbi:site-specific integrase [Actinoplanes sichuanensis]|nr:site-specific integrase [Actinoplanes sichuanensis]
MKWANPRSGSGTVAELWTQGEFDQARSAARMGRTTYPIFISPQGWPDPDLVEFAVSGDLAAKARSTQTTYAHEIWAWLDFLYEKKHGLDWRDATVEDLRDYEYWRCRDTKSEDRRKRLVGGDTWQKILAAIACLYDWAVHRKIVATSPAVYRALTGRGGSGRGRLEQRPTDVQRSDVRWLTRRAYERWRRIGFEDYNAAGLRRGIERIRTTSRNVAFADFAYGTGLRRREIGGLLTIDLPRLDEDASMLSGWLAAALGKGRRGRVFYIDRRHLTRVYAYIRDQRRLSIKRAEHHGRYDEIPDKMIVTNVRRLGGRNATVTYTDEFGGAPQRNVLNAVPLDQRMRMFQQTEDGLEPLWLWLRENGLPQPIERWNSVFAEANKRMVREGLKQHVTPHMLRHSYALHMLCQAQNAYLLRSGMAPDERRQYQALFGNVWELVRDLLGHASVETTKDWYLEPVRGLHWQTLLMAQDDSPVADTDTILSLVSKHSGLVYDVPKDLRGN